MVMLSADESSDVTSQNLEASKQGGEDDVSLTSDKPIEKSVVQGSGEGEFSPFAGCSIFIVAGVLVAGMVSFLIWQYFQTKEMVRGFTDEQPQSVELISVKGKEVAQVALKTKLEGFRYRVETKKQGRITLSALELNLAIVSFDILKPHRGALHISRIDQQGIHGEISFPTRWKMFSDAKRYINAEILVVPELVDGAVFPKIVEIHTKNNSEVPETFKQFIAETLLDPLFRDEEIGPVFRGLTAVNLEGDHLVLSSDPEQRLEGKGEVNTQVTCSKSELAIDRTLKGFAVVSVVFLLFVGLVIVLNRRKKMRGASAREK